MHERVVVYIELFNPVNTNTDSNQHVVINCA